MSLRTTLILIAIGVVVIAVACGFLTGIMFRTAWSGPTGPNLAPPERAPAPRGSRHGIVDASDDGGAAAGRPARAGVAAQ